MEPGGWFKCQCFGAIGSSPKSPFVQQNPDPQGNNSFLIVFV